MALELQTRVVELALRHIKADILPTPAWLKRPGRAECGCEWQRISAIYRDLTDRELPESMPTRERRTIDAVLSCRGVKRLFEVDETQHFNCFRARTLTFYNAEDLMAFDRAQWMDRSLQKVKLEAGGFAKPRPPLFPGLNGRHKQRAFRDALCDLLPPLYGFAPTLRIGDFEVRAWLWDAKSDERMSELFDQRIAS